MKRAMSGVAVVAAFSLVACAQTLLSAPPPEDPLAGPAVQASPKTKTLVERDYEGKVRRLELPPEEAALDVLLLSDADRAGADRVIQERAAILDKAVIENIDLLLEFQTARSTGDSRLQRRTVQQLTEKLQGLRERGKPVDEIAGALPQASRDEYRRLVREYHRAIFDELSAEAKAKGDSARPGEILTKQISQAIGAEIKRSYDRQITTRTREFEEVLARLDLSPEQESRVRKIVQDFAQATKLSPTAAQRREVFEKVFKELTREQRRKALEALVQRSSAPSKSNR